MMRKSQSWSVDVVLAAIVFIFAFLLFFKTIGGSDNSDLKAMNREASLIAQKVTSHNSSISLITGNQIDRAKVNDLLKKNYTEIKRELGIVDDFCLYITDQDGNIFPMNGTINGKGSGRINISGTPCTEST